MNASLQWCLCKVGRIKSTGRFRYGSVFGQIGYEVVFEVQKELGSCQCAIKRISLPKTQTKHDSVIRERFATSYHQKIVRYFNYGIGKSAAQPARTRRPFVDEARSFVAFNSHYSATAGIAMSLNDMWLSVTRWFVYPDIATKKIAT